MLKGEHIKNYATAVGFDLCGVAPSRVLGEHRSRYEAGLTASSGGHGHGGDTLPYLAREWRRRLDPSTLLNGARSIVVCVSGYDGHAARDGVAAFAMQPEDYHVRIKRMLREVLERLQAEVPGLRGKVCCDTSPILEKAWAVEAGLGWQGRNSLLVTPELGSFLNLGLLILDDECDHYDEPFSGPGCGECRACVVACPVGAIGETPDGTRTLSTALCISSRTFEYARLHSGAVVEPICGWIEGCDECQRACPKNSRQNIL